MHPADVTVYVIIAVPGTIEVTAPVEASTVATDKSLLLHTPPGTVLLRFVIPPAHTVLKSAVIVPADGNGFTVTTTTSVTEPQGLLTK